MNLKNEFEPIRIWAEEKGIFQKSDATKQYLKLQEEAGELAKALLIDDLPEIEDAIGDCIVVLTNLAELKGLKVEDCINSAYNVIAKRKGEMVNGAFVKES
jgi:NTP pyrophosphatase (non-canonical NTP hydrolase)